MNNPAIKRLAKNTILEGISKSKKMNTHYAANRICMVTMVVCQTTSIIDNKSRSFIGRIYLNFNQHTLEIPNKTFKSLYQKTKR